MSSPLSLKFTLPLRVTTTVEGALVLSDAKDEDVLLIPSDAWGPAHRLRLEELAKTYNAHFGAPAEMTPSEEQAIRAFREKDYVRRLGDQAAVAAMGGIIARNDSDWEYPSVWADWANEYAAALIKAQGYEVPEEDPPPGER